MWLICTAIECDAHDLNTLFSPFQSNQQQPNNPQLVKKDRASAVEAMIANMAMQGKLDCKISEGKLIEMLEGIHGAQQKKAGGDAGKISIQRKKYNFDSDDEDDNDDDLL